MLFLQAISNYTIQVACAMLYLSMIYNLQYIAEELKISICINKQKFILLHLDICPSRFKTLIYGK